MAAVSVTILFVSGVVSQGSPLHATCALSFLDLRLTLHCCRRVTRAATIIFHTRHEASVFVRFSTRSPCPSHFPRFSLCVHPTPRHTILHHTTSNTTQPSVVQNAHILFDMFGSGLSKCSEFQDVGSRIWTHTGGCTANADRSVKSRVDTPHRNDVTFSHV